MSNAYDYLNGTHDLSLPAWGPYANDLFTCSHITDQEKGYRMDFFLVPSLMRRGIFPPDTLRECGYSPWEASGDFRYFSCRQQLIPKDVFYAETSYSYVNEACRLARIEYVNTTDELQTASLFLFARFAPESAVVPQLPAEAVWLDAVDYAHLAYAHIRPDYHAVFNGARRGIEEVGGTVGGCCIGAPHINRLGKCFGAFAGDEVDWDYAFAGADRGVVFMRAKLEAGEKASLAITVNGISSSMTLSGTGEFVVYELFRGLLSPSGTIRLVSGAPSNGLRIDGVVVSPDCQASEIGFAATSSVDTPHSEAGPIPCSAVIRSSSGAHFMWWSSQAYEREYNVSNIVDLLNYSYGIRHPLYNPSEVTGGRAGSQYIKEAYFIPITIPAKGSTVLYALFAEGDQLPQGVSLDEVSLEALSRQAHQSAFPLKCTPAGAGYRLGEQLMAAALMTNIKFPIRCLGKTIRHHSPDKFFNSLYTWDSGFIGLGLLELDKTRAIENLNVYVTPPEEENAFINHGTPLPVQSYLFQEIWNRTQDKEALEYFYPRLKHFYDFLAGHLADTTSARFKTGLLQTWDIFYNSGGWDDYSPQWQMFREQNYDVAPCVTTAHATRFAKTLRHCAQMLGKNADIAVYDADIARFTDALQKYAWSEKDGVFSYVQHDAQGEYVGIYRDPASGQNFNFGFDGVVPLVTGECTPEQQELLWSRLESPEHLWTAYGLTAVDQSAPYYLKDGYWNGAIWMPHQWFFWKSALDHGRGDFARRIAKTGLNVWKHETDQSYYTFEHFSAINGRGCGCHHFGGLSTPVLAWYNAYYKPGRLTGGMDFWILDEKHEGTTLEAEIRLTGHHGRTTLLYVPENERPHTITYRGEPVEFQQVDGVLELSLPDNSQGKLRLE